MPPSSSPPIPQPPPRYHHYHDNCEDLRKFHCDHKPGNDRQSTSVHSHCAIAVSPSSGCRYFSPDCTCSYLSADSRTVTVQLGRPALERTDAQTKNECKNASSTEIPPTRTTTRTTTPIPIFPSPTVSNKPNMAVSADSSNPMTVSLATINVAILFALFF
ncbi:hypothetical protein BGX29_002836 [Mortierella sp. GBA35]|nr:hypothetical protein BGX29_002836 [Mortierella sp. GBA35]